jgi:chorismate synthase
MVPATRRKKRDEIKITIGPFRNVADYGTCVDIQREVWALDDIDVVPASMLIAADHSGGITLGAYSSLGEMIGFVASILGSEGGRLLQHSHMLGVRQAYRNFDVGYRIKLAQRKEALRRKIGLVVWTFDPMQPLNAYFNLGKLGARSNVYSENFYGETTSALHRGLPTDRLVTRWELEDDAVKQRLDSGTPHHDLRKELKRYTLVNTLSDVAPGMAASSPLKLNCDTPELLFEVPYNLPEIKNRNLGVALEWQGKMRQFFRTYFRKGYAAKDFWVAEDEGHLRAFYLLEKAH